MWSCQHFRIEYQDSAHGEGERLNAPDEVAGSEVAEEPCLWTSSEKGLQKRLFVKRTYY